MKTYSIPPHLKPEAIDSLEQTMIKNECSKCIHKKCETCNSKQLIENLRRKYQC